MCSECWDAEKMADKLNKGEDCDGVGMLTMTLEELKDKLLHEWMETAKTDFHIFRKAILNVNAESISWKATSANKKVTLKVHFI